LPQFDSLRQCAQNSKDPETGLTTQEFAAAIDGGGHQYGNNNAKRATQEEECWDGIAVLG